MRFACVRLDSGTTRGDPVGRPFPQSIHVDLNAVMIAEGLARRETHLTYLLVSQIEFSWALRTNIAVGFRFSIA
jgi:hypothetical protein